MLTVCSTYLVDEPRSCQPFSEDFIILTAIDTEWHVDKAKPTEIKFEVLNPERIAELAPEAVDILS